MDLNHGALFDLDGVLIDSESTYTRFWQDIDRMYPTGIENYAIAIKGTTLPEIMKHYSDPEVIADILQRIHDFQEQMTFSLYPGVLDFLKELRSCGIPCAIVTSSDERKMERLFEQLPELPMYFDKIIDASMVSRSKPDPQGYLLAAEALGRKPEQCYVFEDSLQGLKAGNASGATVIGIATTYPAAELQGRAHLIIDSLSGFTVERMLAVHK